MKKWWIMVVVAKEIVDEGRRKRASRVNPIYTGPNP
jgi:hypothetical protein